MLQAERETIAEREALEREEEEAAAREKARLVERKKETHEIVVERVALEEAAIRAAAQALPALRLCCGGAVELSQELLQAVKPNMRCGLSKSVIFAYCSVC